MDIYEFINSKDVREYNIKLKTEFTNVAKANIINSSTKPIEEKISAFETLLSECDKEKDKALIDELKNTINLYKNPEKDVNPKFYSNLGELDGAYFIFPNQFTTGDLVKFIDYGELCYGLVTYNVEESLIWYANRAKEYPILNPDYGDIQATLFTWYQYNTSKFDKFNPFIKKKKKKYRSGHSHVLVTDIEYIKEDELPEDQLILAEIAKAYKGETTISELLYYFQIEM